MQSIVPLVGRVLLAVIFLISGFKKATGFAGTAAYIGSKGLPMAEVLALGAVVVELGGAVLLLIGWKTRVAAAALAAFTLVAGVLFHNFWAFPPEQVGNQMNHFLKNLAIVGGFLYVMAYGPGTISVEGRTPRALP